MTSPRHDQHESEGRERRVERDIERDMERADTADGERRPDADDAEDRDGGRS